jgi:peptidyl-prolyl cis-trans isomerase D
MLRFFRGFTRSWFGPAIMGLLVIAFGVLGSGSVRSILSGRIADSVVQAGSHSVSQAQFGKIFERQQQDYLKQTGQPYPLEEAVKEGVDRDMLQKLSAQTAYAEMLTQSGIAPSDGVVALELKRMAESGHDEGIAQLFDAVTGKFKPDALRMLLQNNGISMDEFQRELSDEIADNEFGAAISAAFEPPRIYAAAEATLLLESRDVTYFVIPVTSVPTPPQPTDAQLTQFMQQHRDQLMLPERRKLTVLRFSAKALAPTITVDPAAVEQQFEAKKATYAKPELRSLVEIPLNDPTSAAAVQAALLKGQDPEAVAKTVGVDAITYADQPETGVADRKAAAAAFGMTAGQVSGPVSGDFKTVILKVTKITPAQTPDLAAAKAQITADLQKSQAIDKVYDLSQKFEDLRNGGASFAAAAAKLGLTPVTVGPVSADGKDLITGQIDPVLSQKAVAAGFQLPQNGDSDVTADTDKGEYFAVHVDQVTPPSLPSLDEPGVRVALSRAFQQQAVIAGLRKESADAQGAIKGGQTLDAVAAKYSAKVNHQLGLQQATAQQFQQTLGQAFLGAVFDQKAGQVFAVGSDPLKGMVIGRIDAIHVPDPKQIALVLETVRQRTAEAYLNGVQGRGGLQSAIRDAALHMVKPSTDLTLARTAMGVDAAMAARLTKAAATNSLAK